MDTIDPTLAPRRTKAKRGSAAAERPTGKRQPQTGLLHDAARRSQFGETGEAIFMSSGYVYEDAEEAEHAFQNDGHRFVYSRFRNPTVAMFEDRLAAYEGAERCFATASGMAAVHAALLATIRAGQRVVAPYALFGSCSWIITELLPRYEVEVALVDGTDLDQWRAALAKPAAFVFLESPANPTLELLDLAAIAELTHAAGAKLIVDNVFATPVLQKPLRYGADIIVYSTTKHIDGQGRGLGGAILCDEAFAKELAPFLRHTGPTMSPFNAWLALKGLETMELRVRAQSATALTVARWLERRPEIARVLYPGLSSHPQYALAARQMPGGSNLIAFHMAGEGDQAKAAAFDLMRGLETILISNNLGDSKSLICHPATSTHQRLSDAERARVGIGPGTIRLSVGLEAAEDLIGDLERALGG